MTFAKIKNRLIENKFKLIALLLALSVGLFYASLIKKSLIMAVVKLKSGPQTLSVIVTPAKKQSLPVFFNYVGNTASMRNVDIRARVEGFLTEQRFVEGADVNEGDLLYVIDPSPFKAALDQKLAKLAKDRSALEFAKKELERYRPLVKKEYITKEAFDQYETNAEQAQATVNSDEADVEVARLNLGYCTMYAPFSGRIGKTFVHVGNLVGATVDTTLATLVQLDPIYVYFSPSDNDLRQILEKQQRDSLKIKISFSDGTDFPHDGKVDFINNVVDKTTSTVTTRAIVPNPQKLLLPGVYVNVKLFLSEMTDAIVIPEKALNKTQKGFEVLVVDSNGLVDDRTVETANTNKGLTVITKGLNEGELVITDGIQRTRPGMIVKPTIDKQ